MEPTANGDHNPLLLPRSPSKEAKVNKIRFLRGTGYLCWPFTKTPFSPSARSSSLSLTSCLCGVFVTLVTGAICLAVGYNLGRTVATPTRDSCSALAATLPRNELSISEAAFLLPPDCRGTNVIASLGRGNPLVLPWAGYPAQCSVQGLLIEALMPQVNFRPRFTVGFTWDIEDKHHLAPWLLAARKDFSNTRRRIYVDFGGKEFESSARWFMTSYPLRFDEMHVFEMRRGIFEIPSPGEFKASDLSRIRVYEGMKVSNEDRKSVLDKWAGQVREINATRWILEDLAATRGDALIIKMDIEGSEWPLLKEWVQSPLMGELVDELFVEVHYGHESMERFGAIWNPKNNTHTRHQAAELLHSLRANGIYAHAWP